MPATPEVQTGLGDGARRQAGFFPGGEGTQVGHVHTMFFEDPGYLARAVSRTAHENDFPTLIFIQEGFPLGTARIEAALGKKYGGFRHACLFPLV